ncbi:hypothetical protein [Polaromonas sp. UC242_47]|uniref:hypothetical protein n=1 Tax=Polaromonas sp. UC242_47 TaxID=3374626 RepID=UPI00379BCB25
MFEKGAGSLKPALAGVARHGFFWSAGQTREMKKPSRKCPEKRQEKCNRMAIFDYKFRLAKCEAAR